MIPQNISSDATDEVDRIILAWQIERPDLDVSPMEVYSRVARLARHLDLARKEAFSAQGMEPWEFDVLSVLRRAAAPYSLTPGTLLQELLVSSGTMTNRIDRLEKKGLVKRTPSPHDRRAVLVTLTDKGVTRVDAALKELLRRESELVSPLDEDERKVLSGLLRRLLLPFEGTPVRPLR
ncbi:MarR family winged helix-turn-helix transcriptional regulator [Varibaculum massiliense]|uniref:MarR family winged helix-turn-helix transcriptional regulator n=1 Tax=Varibaculum massiliense TaxID=1852372 RepID=UPI000AA2601F|nr:MarR family transcriptional regulator [Varibaculum massiliense]